MYIGHLWEAVRSMTLGYVGSMIGMVGGGLAIGASEIPVLDAPERIIRFIGTAAFTLGAVGGVVLTIYSLIRAHRDLNRERRR